MRLATLLLALIALAPAVLADDAATSSPVVVLRGSSAPPTPWYEPPPQPTIVVQPAYVPLYYPVVGYGAVTRRHGPHSVARRNR